MTGRPWYAHYPADYERKTSHLTMLEDGAYRRLLDHYYATAKPLPANAEHLYRICRAFADAERAAIDSTLAQFFVRKRDGYHNVRADEELQKATELGEKRRNAAFSRHAKAPANAEHLDTQSQSPSQSHVKEKSISAVPALKHISRKLLNGHQKEFDEFWATYPKRVDKRDAMKAYVQALGRADAAVILEGAKGYARSRKDEEPQFTKGPAHWLRADCWLDEAPIAEGNAPDPDFAAALAAEAEHRKKHGEIE